MTEKHAPIPSTQPAWANPSPAGLVALAVACFCFFALLSGRVEHSAQLFLGIWLLGGFVVQLCVGLIDLRSNNTTGGNTFLFFCAFFMLVGGLENITKYFIAGANLIADARIDGWAWLALSLVVWGWTPAFAKQPLLLFLIIVGLDIACPVIALMDMKVLSSSFALIPAVALLADGIIALYLCSAIVTNTAYGRAKWPIPGPVAK